MKRSHLLLLLAGLIFLAGGGAIYRAQRTPHPSSRTASGAPRSSGPEDLPIRLGNRTSREGRSREFMERWLKVAREGTDTEFEEFMKGVWLWELSEANYREFLDAALAMNSSNPKRTSRMLSGLLGNMVQHHPEQAIAELEKDLPQLSEPGYRDGVIASVVSRHPDPRTGADWLLAHFDQFSEDPSGGVMTGRFLSQIFARWSGADPGLAMELMDQFPENSRNAIGRGIARGATPENFSELLAAVPPPEGRSQRSPEFLEGLGEAMQAGDAEHPSFQRWKDAIDAARFSPEERSHIIEGLPASAFVSETPLWLEWLVANSTPEQIDEKLESYENSWGMHDLGPPLEWAKTAPDSPAKQKVREMLGNIRTE